MADHPDRYTCGRCGFMAYRRKKDGSRFPIPKNNKPAVAAPEAKAAGKAAPKKGGKKK